MATNPKRVYWDACVWIALIQQEKNYDTNGSGRLIEDRFTFCMSVIKEAEAKKLEIVTSSLSLAEVCKSTGLKAQDEEIIAQFFENDYILLVAVDRMIGERARNLMMSGLPGLKPPDAVHLATAAITAVDAMHTFDGKLLALDGFVDTLNGTKLKIAKPDVAKSSAPLLEFKPDFEGQTPQA